MPSYFYRARDSSGRAHEGIEVASSEEEVLRILEGSQLTPVLIETRQGAARENTRARAQQNALEWLNRLRNQVKPVSVALFARQLSTMISAGLPIVRSLRSISRDHEDKKLSTVLDQVADDVEKGEALSAGLAKHPGAFDDVFVSLVHTGEVSGTLDKIMDQTATYLERAETLRLKVQAALRYPIFVFSFAALILIAMVVKIIPMFAAIYERFRVPLPLPTKILLAISNAVVGNLLVFLILAALLIWALASYLQTPAGRLWLDRLKLNLPLFGPLIRMYAITKVSRTLGILISSGTQILFALKVMKPVPGNRVLEKGIDEVRGRVEEGSSLSRAMEEAEVFPEMLVQMTATGEETGHLDEMLTRTADFYEQRVSAQVDGLSSLVEPVAIVVLGGLVGVMLLALYLPIFNLGQAMRQGLIGR